MIVVISIITATTTIIVITVIVIIIIIIIITIEVVVFIVIIAIVSRLSILRLVFKSPDHISPLFPVICSLLSVPCHLFPAHCSMQFPPRLHPDVLRLWWYAPDVLRLRCYAIRP